MGKDTTISLDDLSERIADSIIDLPSMSSKEDIRLTVRSQLKIWHDVTNRPVERKEPKTPKAKLQYTIEKRGIEREFWRKKLISIIGKENMQEHYDELTSLLKDMGHYQFNNQ